MAIELYVPGDVVFHERKDTNESPGFQWVKTEAYSLFAGKRVVMIGVPGAWTPTCSSTHLPGYETDYDEIIQQDIDDVYCVSVNDSFTMNAWFNHLGIEKVKPIPDGNGDFTRSLGMLVKKDNLGFGDRSWRYSAVVDDGRVEMIFVEEGKTDLAQTDPFQISDSTTMLHYLKGVLEEYRRVKAEEAQEDPDSDKLDTV